MKNVMPDVPAAPEFADVSDVRMGIMSLQPAASNAVASAIPDRDRFTRTPCKFFSF